MALQSCSVTATPWPEPAEGAVRRLGEPHHIPGHLCPLQDQSRGLQPWTANLVSCGVGIKAMSSGLDAGDLLRSRSAACDSGHAVSWMWLLLHALLYERGTSARQRCIKPEA